MKQVFNARLGLLHVTMAIMLATGAIAQKANAQETTPAASAPPVAETGATMPPAEIRQVLQLMQAPAVQNWLHAQNEAPPAEAEVQGQMPALSNLLEQVRHHVDAVSNAAMELPDQALAAADRIDQDVAPDGAGRITLELLLVLVCGSVAELIFRTALRMRGRRTPGSMRPHSPVSVLFRAIVPPLVFALATLVPLLALAFPPLSQALAIASAIALVATRFALAFGRLVVRLITLPVAGGSGEVAEETAFFWFRRVTLFLVYFAAGWALLQVLPLLDFPKPSRLVVAYLLGLGLLAIAMEAICRRPVKTGHRSIAASWLLSLYCVLLWGFWVAGFSWLLWLGIYGLVLPPVLSITTKALRALHRAEEGFLATRPIAVVLLDRGVRALIIAVAAVWMGYVLGLGAEAMMAPETPLSRFSRGVISGIVVLLAADLVWHLIRAGIDLKLIESPLSADLSDEEKARRARMQTLLPIFRNISAVVVAVLAGMMVLSGLGIEIAPLIAGAGIVGVALGFGAQTLVKDVISGVFYLWDDAFRIGEYIESGSHKGVVEAFSLRSIKLRHHRGPLTTVPFGSLGAVRNLNRDWTIDKISVRVPYATDLVLMKKVIKQIGQALLDNPEFGPNIIETLKMKGVEEFSDFAIVIRLSMTTKPGTQFVIRRTALALIRNAFSENGIEFAVPTIQVAGGQRRDADALSVAAQFAAQAATRGETAA